MTVTNTFTEGDEVKAGELFSGVVISVLPDRVVVQNDSGVVEHFSHKDLEHKG